MLISVLGIPSVSELIQRGWYGIGFFLDKAVYGLISFLYTLFNDIASVRILNSEIIDDFKNRVYLIMAVITLFIIVYSLLQLIVNPDKGASGEFTVSKVIFNLIKSTILILLVPTLFSFAYRLQGSIMNKHFISRLVTGKYSENENVGSQFSIPVFQGFFYIKNEYENDENLKKIYQSVEEQAYYNDTIEEFDYFLDADRNISTGGNIYPYTDNDTIDYRFPISTIAGFFVAYVLLVYCFDVAVRTIKLGFFEIIAPLPILISIIPKQDKIFNNWLKATLKTYFELFIRIFVLSMSAFMISRLSMILDEAEFSGNTNFLVKTFVIIGVVMFLRKAPKLLSDLFGFDMKNANMSLRDRLRDSGLTALAGGALGTGAYMTSTATALRDRKDLTKWQKGRKFLKQGLVQGFTRGGKAGFQEGWHNGTLQGMGAASNYAIHTQKAYARGSNWLQVQGELLRDDFGFMSYYDREKARVEIGRDSEKLLRDRTLRESSKLYDKFVSDNENKFAFESKTKANDRAISKFNDMETKAKDQVSKKTSKTLASVRQFTSGKEKLDTLSFDINDVYDPKDDKMKSSIKNESRKMNSDEMRRELGKVNQAFNNGNLSSKQFSALSDYYNNQIRAYDSQAAVSMLSDNFVSMNSSQIDAEIERVNAALGNGSISDAQHRQYIDYYEGRKKALHKQNVSDAMLYSSILSKYQTSDSSHDDQADVRVALGSDYNSTSKEIKGFATKYCYEDYVAATGDNSKSADDFRFASHKDMADAILGTMFASGDSKVDVGRVNNLSELSNAVALYQTVANDDSVNLRYDVEGSGNTGSATHQEVTGANSVIGEDIFKGKDDLIQANLKVKHEKQRIFSSSEGLDKLNIPKGLKDRFGEISSYDELERFIDTIKDESKTINDKYNADLEYLKFLEPSKEASENVKKFRNKYRGKRKE